MIDGIHEDLNLVKKKPGTTLIEGEGRPDEYVAKISWENHLKRNKSKILDLLGGQFKSVVECPTCDRVSVCFDPYLIISVPIPISEDLPEPTV